MSYSCLRHDGDGDGSHNVFDHLWIRHTGNAALGSDVCGNTLEGHDGAGAGFFCYPCLMVVSVILTKLREDVRMNTCSASTTSMITPPFIIFARPALTVKLVEPFLFSWLDGPWPLVEASLVIVLLS